MNKILNLVVPLLIAWVFVCAIFLIVGLINNEKCANHGKITNTPVKHYMFGGCYVKNGNEWVRFK